DIWAFGCMLYEMLVGKKAFQGETISDVLAAVIRAEPDWNALQETTPPPVQRLIRRCLQKDARRRLQAMGEARLTIEEVLSGAGAEPEPGISGDGSLKSKYTSLLQRAFPWALGAATMLVAAIGGWLLLNPGPAPGV